MTHQVGKKSPKRKARPTFIIPIIMVALVLFILGIIGLVAIHFKEMTTMVKENIQVTVYLKDNVNEVETKQLQKKLETEPFVKKIEYTSKEGAMEKFIAKHPSEKDFMELTEFNPLPASLDLYIKADYMNNDSINKIENMLVSEYNFKDEDIKSDKQLITSVNENLKTIGIILLALVALLIFTVILLIDSTVRLAMYSNRFLIKSMQLVGANRWFITKPYMLKSILNGLLSGILAVIALVGLIYLAQQQFPPLAMLQNLLWWGVLFLGLVVLGIFISWISTFRAVTKYLKMKLDELY